MKKAIYIPNIKRISLRIFIVVLSTYNIAYAQLNGTYIIGPDSSDDYSSFTSAVNDLNNFGVNGVVIFNVKAGTYTEQLTIDTTAGASGSNTITFQSLKGDSSSVILTASPSTPSKNWTLKLNGANYFIFKELTIATTGTTYSRVIEITGRASNNKFLNNYILGSTNTPAGELIYSPNSIDTANRFESNLFKYGSFGLFLRGTSGQAETGTYIFNNEFQSQKIASIFLYYQSAPIIQSNVISLNTGNTQGIFLVGIQNKFKVEKNNINAQNSSSGIGIYLSSIGSSGNEGIIANNFINISNGDGIFLDSSFFCKIYHNTINITGSITSSAGLHLSYSSDILLKNNISVNLANGYSVNFNLSSINSSDYNCFYSNGSNLGKYDSSDHSSLQSWLSTSLDSNSISVLPNFDSNNTGLHLFSMSNNLLKHRGSVLSDVKFDYDGDMRHNLTPDIGADEFLFLDFGNDTFICDGKSIVLDAGYGYNSYKWQDNSTNRTFTVDSQGTYWVEIKDVIGNSWTDTIYVTMKPNPIADFSITDSAQCLSGNSFTFNNISSISSGTYSSKWNFGDGKDSTVANVVHSYSLADTFIVNLIVNSNFSCKDSISKNVYTHPHPISAFSINDSSQCFNNNNYTFTNKSTISPGSFLSFWDFGDSNTSVDTNGVHSYLSADTFTVKLLVTSALNCKDSLNKLIYIKPSPVADFFVNDSTQCVKGNQFTFLNNSFIGGIGTFSTSWNFGDEKFSTDTNGIHSFSSSDTFGVKLIITSNLGCKDSVNKSTYLYPDPVADFSINDSTQCIVGNSFAFTNNTNISYGSLNYFWQLGDGDTAVTTNSTHSYNSFDTFIVILTTVSTLNCADTITKNVYVYPTPNADFTIDDNSQCLNTNIFNFTNKSSISYDSIFSIIKFGDGVDTSLDSNINYSYISDGTYQVTLISNSSKQCADSISKTIYVNPNPKADFTITDTIQCFDSNYFEFLNISSISLGSYTSVLSFGDGKDTSTFDTVPIIHNYLNSGIYDIELLTISDSSCRDSVSKNVYIDTLPQVITNPMSQKVFMADTIILYVTVDKSPVDYQWKKSWSEISNETNSSLIFNGIVAGDINSYKCIVLNNCGIDSSDFATLTLHDSGKITGNVYKDINSDCIKQVGEEGISGRLIRITPGPYYTSTDSAGNFQTIVDAGSVSVQLVDGIGKYANWMLNSCNVDSNLTVVAGYTNPNKNFATKLKPNFIDVNVNLIPNSGWMAQRGYDNNFTIVYSNYGSEIVNSGIVEFTFDSQLSYIKASEPPTINDNVLSWNFTNLLPGQTKSIFVELNNPVSLLYSDSLQHVINITPVLNDSNISNNFDTINQKVVAAIDPNDKQNFPEGNIPYGASTIDYTIRFQNVGTAYARRVIVIDTLDMNLLNSAAEFVLIKGASHEYELDIKNNVFIWTFNNIMLPDSNKNESGSHGSIRFSVAITPDIAVGTEIVNKAYIYFDYEIPLPTNLVWNKIIDTTNSINKANYKLHDNYYKMYPIPVKDNLYIENLKMKHDHATIYNDLGQMIENVYFEPLEAKVINTQKLSNGIYIFVSHGFNHSMKFLIAH